MSTRGIVDLVVCLDASASMLPCIDAVRRHVHEFLRGLGSGGQTRTDCRLDFLAHCCDRSGDTVRLASLRHRTMKLLRSLYHGDSQGMFFTAELEEFRSALDKIEVVGDEATLIALDTALDYPWRPRQSCHRVVISLTDEPLEAGALVEMQTRKVPELIDKIHGLGVMLYLVAPDSAAYRELAEADKCEYHRVAQSQDGLGAIDFKQVLSYIGKSVSLSRPQTGADRPVRRALFAQDRWTSGEGPIRGR